MRAEEPDPLSITTGRFLSVDPVRTAQPQRPQEWNRYSYVRNSPLIHVDPDGREAIVFIVGASNLWQNWRGNWGHAAIWVSHKANSAGVSYGGEFGFQANKGYQQFVSAYLGAGRVIRAFTLATTPQQDAAMLAFLRTNPDGAVTAESLAARLMLTENCTTAVCNTLAAGGISQRNIWSFFHRPEELLAALEVGGELSRWVTGEINYRPPVVQVQAPRMPMFNHLDSGSILVCRDGLCF